MQEHTSRTYPNKDDLSTPFKQWPEIPRYSVRNMIEWMGGQITGYTRNGLIVKYPCGLYGPVSYFSVFKKSMLAAGFGCALGDCWVDSDGKRWTRATFTPRGLV